MTETDMDTAILMARFKIQARKHLDLSVDLDKLEHDESYAQTVLQKAEEDSEDESLLVLVMRLRSRLKARSEAELAPAAPAPEPIPATVAPARVMRDHRFGARG